MKEVHCPNCGFGIDLKTLGLVAGITALGQLFGPHEAKPAAAPAGSGAAVLGDPPPPPADVSPEMARILKRGQ